jgi:aspartate aminotransferase-like enzyme
LKGELVMVDAVSSLGYYHLPDADAIVTSSAKILGGLPVMGIVIVKKDLLNDGHWSYGGPYYLDLRRYVDSAKNGQTPHTSLLPQLISLNNALNNTIAPETIMRHSQYTANHLTKLERIGDCPAPVLTFKFPKSVNPKKIYNRLLDYGIEVYMNPLYHKDQFQISCFSERDIRAYQYMVMVLNYLIKGRC